MQNFIEEIRTTFDFVDLVNFINSFNFARTTKDIDSNRWNATKIEFFDSHYDDKTIAIALTIEYIEKDIYFCDVHVFIERCKNMVAIKDSKIIKNNLYIYLRGVALK